MRCSLLLALGLIGGAVCGITRRAAADEPLPIYPTAGDDTTPSIASEDEAPRPRFDDHPFAIQLRIGAAAATGFAGFVLEYSVHDRLALNLGVGTNLLGISNSVGARVRPVVVASGNGKQLHALILETSLARSAYAGDLGASFFCEDRCLRPKYVGWGQLETGWEARFGRLILQTSLGAAALLGNPQFSCEHGQYDPDYCASAKPAARRVLFSQTIGVGYAF